MPSAAPPPRLPQPGILLRAWRERRKLSQLDLSCETGISTRHLSFLETGRSLPSRATLLKLCEELALPLRERNRLFLAAGFAPAYPERSLEDPALRAAQSAMQQVLIGIEPNPALVIDSHWTLVASNRFIAPLLTGVAAHLLQPPVNVLRLSLHPEGLAPRIVNLQEWRQHLLERLRRQMQAGDSALIDLMHELRNYPPPRTATSPYNPDAAVIPFQLRLGEEVLNFFGTTMVFGTPLDVTLAELAIETFFPVDAGTASALQRLASTPKDSEVSS